MGDDVLRWLSGDDAHVCERQGETDPAALGPPGGAQSFRVVLGVRCGQGRSSRVAGLGPALVAPIMAGLGPWMASSAVV